MGQSALRARRLVCVPRFTAPPTISGTAKVGQTLTGSSGTISRGTATARRWLRGGVAIAGATGATYVVQAADIGNPITHEVTATSSLNARNTVKVTSTATAAAIA